MVIDDSNTDEGNKAVAAALLLYYHLAEEGCFCGGETVYIDPDVFDGFRFLDVVVAERHDPEINQEFLREAAVIYLLCDLNDMITEHELTFHSSGIVGRIISEFELGKMSSIPEVEGIFALLKSAEEQFDFSGYSCILAKIHMKYVRGLFKRLSS